jgi:hypothetical protein
MKSSHRFCIALSLTCFLIWPVVLLIQSPSSPLLDTPNIEFIVNNTCTIDSGVSIPSQLSAPITAGAPIICGKNPQRTINALAVKRGNRLYAHVFNNGIESITLRDSVSDAKNTFILLEIKTTRNAKCNSYYNVVHVTAARVEYMSYKIQPCSPLIRMSMDDKYLYLAIPSKTSLENLFTFYSYSIKGHSWIAS